MSIKWLFLFIGLILINGCSGERKPADNTANVHRTRENTPSQYMINTLALYNCISNDTLSFNDFKRALFSSTGDDSSRYEYIGDMYSYDWPKARKYIREYMKCYWLLTMKLMNNPAIAKRFSYDSFKKFIEKHRADLSKEIIYESFGEADNFNINIDLNSFNYEVDTILSTEGVIVPSKIYPYMKSHADWIRNGNTYWSYDYFVFGDLKSTNRFRELYRIDFILYDTKKPMAVIAQKILIDSGVFRDDWTDE